VRDGRTSDLSQAPEVAPYFDVHRERIRAHQKHGAQGNSREDAHWTNVEWLPILMEELGEAAHELTYDARLAEVSVPDGEDRQLRKAALRAELVQVAAMACAWIAAIDRG
jgi:hypothetical protein